MSNYSLIAAVSDNLVIGKDNRMPWHVPEDLKLFKRLTLDNFIIMGRKTFESIGRPLPGRTTIVVTSAHREFSRANSSNNLIAVPSIEAAIETAGRQPEKEIFIAGGASIYAQAIRGASKLYLSRIPGDFEGDTFFPGISNTDWILDSEEDFPGFRLEIYRKK
ncbi:MAG: dihydrofolate reductase [Spirochaetales bacterium]|uniref:Dihydrofolate reductase n=1 Tax=Candidatus Thalassospirochaeta sargassi TaxID=3119039 RepID=A0AAJ1IF54_9SPIO|nr:dihydrofolate reductase [Spirochaetales bacterium]